MFALATFGMVAHTLSFIIFFRQKLKNYSFTLYFKVMAIADSFFLLHSYRFFAIHVLDLNLLSTSAFMCKITQYTLHFTTSISLWCLVLITFDRLMNIMYHSRLLMRKVYFQLILVALVTLLSASYYSSYLVLNNYTETRRNITNFELNVTEIILVYNCVFTSSAAPVLFFTDFYKFMSSSCVYKQHFDFNCNYIR
jgi:hypothetical protein